MRQNCCAVYMFTNSFSDVILLKNKVEMVVRDISGFYGRYAIADPSVYAVGSFFFLP